MKTTLYLIRQAATEASATQPQRLHGRKHNPPLARLGVRQAELTRDFLAVRPIDHCYCSPLLRAVQTASILAAPHGLSPLPLDALTDCDVGGWDGLDWTTIRFLDADAYRRFAADPARSHPPGGESLHDVQGRVTAALEGLMLRHAGHSILVVAHQLVHRTYLAGVLGLGLDQLEQVRLDNCGISVVVRDGERTSVSTLNAAFHLQGMAA